MRQRELIFGAQRCSRGNGRRGRGAHRPDDRLDTASNVCQQQCAERGREGDPSRDCGGCAGAADEGGVEAFVIAAVHLTK